MSIIQTNLFFKTYFQKVNQHTGGKCLIHGIKHHKNNLFQSLHLPMQKILVENINIA